MVDVKRSYLIRRQDLVHLVAVTSVENVPTLIDRKAADLARLTAYMVLVDVVVDWSSRLRYLYRVDDATRIRLRQIARVLTVSAGCEIIVAKHPATLPASKSRIHGLS